MCSFLTAEPIIYRPSPNEIFIGITYRSKEAVASLKSTPTLVTSKTHPNTGNPKAHPNTGYRVMAAATLELSARVL